MPVSRWHARGLVFENCNCQLLCPGHVSFRNDCTHERCRGNWAIHIDTGGFDEVDLGDLNAVSVFEAPRRMYDGGWTQACYIDERATPDQRAALDTILGGRAGGPWAILGRFVATRLETRFVPMAFEDDGRDKRLTIPDLFETTVTAIRGGDREQMATIENLHNVLHGRTHVLGRGGTRCKDRLFDFAHEETHGLYSRFMWQGTG